MLGPTEPAVAESKVNVAENEADPAYPKLWKTEQDLTRVNKGKAWNRKGVHIHPAKKDITQ